MIKPFYIYLGGAFAAGLLVLTQVDLWQTGRVATEPLELVIAGPVVPQSTRVWIDTDAACGATPRTDPDDCFAIVWLASHGFAIAGISTSFGNAKGPVVERSVASLVQEMIESGLPAIPVWKGHAEPVSSRDSATQPGVTALRSALEGGPLTILALGPLTNIAAALDGRPDLYKHITRIVAVMGHRPGHLFHPAEGKSSGALFSHGPIFRDLNFAMDSDAASRVLAMNLPLTLIPYDAAHEIIITAPDLERFADRGPIFSSVAKTAQGWLKFWNEDVGLPGFYPFDWVASAYVASPHLFNCAQAKAWFAREWAFWLVPRKSLLVGATSANDDAGHDVLYCPQTASSMHEFLLLGREE